VNGYDPNGDPGNFPLVYWERAVRGLLVTYDPGADAFGGHCGPTCWGHVPVRMVQMVAGLGDFARAGAFAQTTEQAAVRWFQHEGFLRSLHPTDNAQEA
jgi:hypothetical protein